MIELASVRIDPADASPARRAERREFVFLAEGAAMLCFRGRFFPMERGCTALVLPGESRAVRGGNRSGAVCRILSFDDEWALGAGNGAIALRLDSLDAAVRRGRRLGAEVLASVERKALAAGDGGRSGLLRAALLESLFLELSLELLRSEEDRRGQDAPWWLRRACGAMERGKNLRLGPSRLAELAGKSPEHVIRQMRRYYGTTPTRYVNELRLRRASDLLVDSGRPVLDISYSLGFENPSYFSRLFKEKYGMTPSRFRAGLRG